jgi:hypothetical protein
MNATRGAVVRTAVLLTAVVAQAGCAAGANPVVTPPGGDVAGFWQGLWHGIIAPITLIVSWFSDSVGIYDVHNNGGWYDFGFMLGLSIVFGGSHGSRVRDRRRRRTDSPVEPPR